MKISVVTPVFSEDVSLHPLIEGLYNKIGNYLHEIIIIYHPDSSQECLNILKNLQNEYRKLNVIPQDLTEPGNGSAFRQGFNHVSGSHVLMIDSDGEMDIDSIPDMIEKMMTSDVDLVIGSRHMKGGGFKGSYPAIKLIFWTNITDLTYGFKLMKITILNNILLVANHQHIGAETTLKPIKYGYKVDQVPTIHRFRQSGMDHSLSLFGNFRYPFMAIKILFGKKNK